MPRLPYKTDDEAGPADLVAAIRQRRGGHLANLDRVLLYSPAFARGWGEMMPRVRNELALPPLLKELAMCTVAALNDAAYEFHHHGPLYLQAGGTQAQLDALRAIGADTAAAADGDLAERFDPLQRAALQLSLEMTRDVQVTDATFAAARQALGDDQHLFELIGVIAAYNMVSRILVALDVQVEA
jgi:alkylhydroperoxidase family enzyme